MKRAKQRCKKAIVPRNPVARDPLLQKGGAHRRRDKRAARALRKQQDRKLMTGEGS